MKGISPDNCGTKEKEERIMDEDKEAETGSWKHKKPDLAWPHHFT
jgi:hypothetical protein